MTDEHLRAQQQKSIRRMNRVDKMIPELRKCVHEYGLTIVDAFLDIGVFNPRHIRHIVNMVRTGSIDTGSRRSDSQILNKESK